MLQNQLCCHYGPNKKFLMGKISIRHSGTDVNEVGVNSEWPEKSLASVILSKCVCHDQSEQQREGICSRGKARQACQGVVQSDRADGLAHIWVDFHTFTCLKVPPDCREAVQSRVSALAQSIKMCRSDVSSLEISQKWQCSHPLRDAMPPRFWWSRFDIVWENKTSRLSIQKWSKWVKPDVHRPEGGFSARIQLLEQLALLAREFLFVRGKR